MVGALTLGKGRAEYTYNGFRNRVGKLEDLSESALQIPDPVTGVIPDPVSEVRYVLDMTLPYDNLLIMQGSSGRKDQSFVWGNELISADGEDQFYYLQDHLGSPARLTGNGLDEALSFNGFGVPSSANSVKQPFGFTRYQTDDVSGMYYAQNRFYIPRLGRFSAIDPFKDGLNFYEYVRSNPLRWVDPSGLWVDAFRDGPLTPKEQIELVFQELQKEVQSHFNAFGNSVQNNVDAIQTGIGNIPAAFAGSTTAQTYSGAGAGVGVTIREIIEVAASYTVVPGSYTFSQDGITENYDLEERFKIALALFGYGFELDVDMQGILNSPRHEWPQYIEANGTRGNFSFNFNQIEFDVNVFWLLGGGFKAKIDFKEFLRLLQEAHLDRSVDCP